MPRIEDGFEALSRVRAPDVWDEALGREPRPMPRGPSGPRRAAIVVVAFAVFVGGFVFVTSTFERSEREPGSSTSVVTTPPPTATEATPSASAELPGGNRFVHPVLALADGSWSSAIASGAGGAVYVSTLNENGDRAIVRWDPATGDVTTSTPIPGTQLAVAGSSVWAIGDRGPDDQRTGVPVLFRLDPTSLSVLEEIMLPAVPSVLGVTPMASIWVGIEDRILVIDPATGSTRGEISVRGVPRLLAFAPSGAEAYVVTDGPAGRDGDLLLELDASTGDGIASAAVGVRELNGPSSMAATDTGVWVTTPTGMMAHASLFAEGTLDEVDAVSTQDATTGSNGEVLSVAGGVVWLSDLSAIRCFDPRTAALRDTLDTPPGPNVTNGRHVVETPAGLLIDGARDVLRLDPPRGCGASG